MIRFRLIRKSYRSLYALAIFIFITVPIWYQYQQHRLVFATTQLQNVILSMSSMEKVILPNQSTVIQEPSTVGLTCQHQNQISSNSDQPKLFLLFMVISSPKNVARRELIRSTFKVMRPKWETIFYQKRKDMGHVGYANNTRLFQLLFFVGQSAKGEISEGLQAEVEFNGDLVVDNMVESYLNLTVKTLRMMKWVLYNCRNAQYLVKMDDDVFVHMPKLINFLLAQKNNPYLVTGNIHSNATVIRDPSSKWFTPKSLYSPKYFPNYVSGYFYIMGMEAAERLFEESKNCPLYYLEDIYLTGFVGTKKLHYELTPLGNFVVEDNYYLNFVPMSWFHDTIIVHEAKENYFRCWMLEAVKENHSWGSKWWPIFIYCWT